MGKFWNGDVRLVKAYWIYGLLLPNGLFLLAWLLGMRLVPGSATAILFGIAMLAYLVFWGVGTWRSATKYQGPKVWAILTKLHLSMPFIGLALAIAIPTLLPSKVNQPEWVEAEKTTVAPVIDDQQSHPTEPLVLSNEPQIHVQTQPGSVTSDAASNVSQSHSNSSHATQSSDAPRVARATSMAEARKRIPELAGLSDESALNVLHEVYYPHWDKAKLAEELGVALPANYGTPAMNVVDYDAVMARLQAMPEQPVVKPKLGWLDQRRYQSCQQDAAKAPTPQGVNVSMRICREQFNQ